MAKIAERDKFFTAICPLLFVIGCLGLALAHSVGASELAIFVRQFGDFSTVAFHKFSLLMVSSLLFFIFFSLFVMLSYRTAALKHQYAALVVAVLGGICILMISSVEMSWLMMLPLFYAVVVPVGNIIWSKFSFENTLRKLLGA